MSEVKVDILKIPQGKTKLSGDENLALDVIEKWEELRQLNAKIAESTRCIAEYRELKRRERKQKLFKAIDVAMWSTVAVGIVTAALISTI